MDATMDAIVMDATMDAIANLNSQNASSSIRYIELIVYRSYGCNS